MAYTSIDNPELYFQVKTYTGNGGSQSITFDGDENLQPDLIWTKRRNGTGSHRFVDTVRGIGKAMFPNGQDADSNETNYASFDSDGFSFSSSGSVNENTHTYVSWAWKAGGSASSNSDGDITSNVSANTTAGFSVVTYTGNGSADATVGHGLGDTISWLLLKNRDDSENWWNYHIGLSDPSTKAILLNSTNGEFTPGTSAFNPSGFSTSLFSLKNDNASNSSGDDYVAWIWSQKKGFSKFGSYVGNGSATNGTFVFLGFKPAWLMVKQSSTNGESWFMWDNQRSNSGNGDGNENNRYLFGNLSNAEGTLGVDVDFLSNGFKHYYGSDATDKSGETYIYLAFAESPFVNSKGIPTNAV